MKKIILIITSFLLLGACGTEHMEECNTIIRVELAPKDKGGTYEVTLNSYGYGEYFYTDSLYQVGDVLCLTLKK